MYIVICSVSLSVADPTYYSNAAFVSSLCLRITRGLLLDVVTL